MKILLAPHPSLDVVCRPFDFVNPEKDPLAFADTLINTMREARGMGLAAPQVGVDLRLFAIKLYDGAQVCFNPEIVKHGAGLEAGEEGCLSFPQKWAMMRRWRVIDVTFQDVLGRQQCRTLKAMEARCFQHELDHLNGITLSPAALAMGTALHNKNRR